MLSIHTKDIRKRLAKKYGLTLEQVDDIIKSPFYFQSKVMKEEVDPNINNTPSTRILNFGLFNIHTHVKKKLDNENL